MVIWIHDSVIVKKDELHSSGFLCCVADESVSGEGEGVKEITGEEMKKRLTCIALVLCLLCGSAPVMSFGAGKVTFPTSMENFLLNYEFGGLTEYDFRTASEEENGGIMSCIVAHPSCVSFRTYPVTQPVTSWNANDPRKWAKNYGSYMTFDVTAAHWVGKKIFNLSDEDISILIRKAQSAKMFYRYGNSYYLPMGGIGDYGRELEELSMQRYGDYYYVHFNHVFNPGDLSGKKDQLGSFYAVLKEKNVGGKMYWSLYAHSKDPLDYQAIADEGDFFHDVKKSAYYRKPVEWALDNGITNGVSDEEFGSLLGCTRAQAVTFLWRAAGSPDTSLTNYFRDVPEEKYYSKAVSWAVSAGITNGISSDHFGPDAICTRGQIVTFLWRFKGCGHPLDNFGYVMAESFSDVDHRAFYYDALLWAVSSGIATGVDTRHFAPLDTCTRAQIVTFLYRAMVEPVAVPDLPPVSL